MASSPKTGGIGASRSSEKDSGGTSGLGRRTKMDDGGDVASLLKFLSGKAEEEPFSYWDAELDDNGRIMNLFFRDSRCASDYELLGDVLLVDTAYKTNKYNLTCVPFMGINQHHEKVMFGLALLSDEYIESFDWLLGTFLKSMFGKQPGVVISDRCHALMDAIDRNFRSSSHRINLNASSHFGSLNRNGEFKKMWHQCVDLCETEAEFETAWRTMVEAHGLSGRAWFIDMYDLRKRWASVFTNDRFSAGLRATMRSKALRDLCSRSISLRELMQQYLRLQAELRRSEAEEDALLTIGHPGPIFPNAMLEQASLAYLRKAYKTFECELKYTFNVRPVIISGLDKSEVDAVYECRSEPRPRLVRLNRRSQRATCTCRMWEAEGILCRHVLAVYNWENVFRLPEEYIMRRWTRDAKNNPQAMALVKERVKRLSEEMKAMRRSDANFEEYQSAIDGEEDCSADVSTVYVFDCPCPASRNADCQRLCMKLFEHRAASTNERESEQMEKHEGKEFWDHVTCCFNLNRRGTVPRDDLIKMASEIQPYHKDGGCECAGRVFGPVRGQWEAPPVFPVPDIHARRVWNEMDAMSSQPTGTDAIMSQPVSQTQGAGCKKSKRGRFSSST